jgi:hypothetical protein
VAASAVCRAAWAEEIAARGEPGDPLGVFVGEEVCQGLGKVVSLGVSAW